jgi:hypothetical protein
MKTLGFQGFSFPAGRMQASPQNTQLIAIIVDHLAKSRVKTLISDFYGKPQKC